VKKTPSIKRNYLFNLVVTVINVGYPIISFSYIARIFGPQVYGSVVFAASFAAYFALVACLGLPVYGSREIARVRDDSRRLDTLYSELLLINALSSAFFFLCYLALFFFVHKIQEDVPLFVLFGLSIILNAFSIDWLFQGLENYAVIALRNFIFRSLSLVLIFVLIHKKADYLQFAAISVISTLGTNVMNVIASRKHVRLSFSGLDVRRHVRPLLAIAGTVIMVSIYSNFDNVLLGFLADDTNVGYYGAAARIVRIVVYCITAIGAVVIPRYSYYIEKKMHEEYDTLARKSIRLMYLLAFPAMVGLFILAPTIVHVLAGSQFNHAISTVRIIVPIIIIIGLSNYIGWQVLFPRGKEVLLFFATSCAALIDIVLNLVLVGHFKNNGTAVALVAAETTVLIIVVVRGWKLIPGSLFDRHALLYVSGSVVMGAAVFFVKQVFQTPLLQLCAGTAAGIMLYAGVLLLFKDSLLIDTAIAGIAKIRNLYRQQITDQIEL